MTNEELKNYRKAKGYTQLEMCELFGVPLRTYQNWEYGERRIPGMVDKFIELFPNITKKEGQK